MENFQYTDFMKSLFRNLTVFQSTSIFMNKRYEIRLTPPTPCLRTNFIKFRFFVNASLRLLPHKNQNMVTGQIRVDTYLCNCFVVKWPGVKKGSVHVKNDMGHLSGTFGALIVLDMMVVAKNWHLYHPLLPLTLYY